MTFFIEEFAHKKKRDPTLVECDACQVFYKCHSYYIELSVYRSEGRGYALCGAEST
jgi:hypothetical protein